VSIAPVFVPALKMPVASARSFLGNHSATALMAPGKFGRLGHRPAAARAAKTGPSYERTRARWRETPRTTGRREAAPHPYPVEQPPRREEAEGVRQAEP